MTTGRTRQGRGKSAPLRSLKEPDSSSVLEKLSTWAAQGLLLVLLVVAPWCLGGVQNWFAAIALALIAACLICWIGTFLTHRRSNELLPVAVLPLLAALSIPWLQVMPLPEGITRALSPSVTAIRQRLLPPQALPLDLPLPEVVAALHGDVQPEQSSPISLYPAATRSRAGLLAMGVAAFALGARFFRRQRALMTLLVVATANGVAVSVFGWIQKLSSEGMNFWNLPPGLSSFGPFIARNNASGFLNVSLACALGLVLCLFMRSKYRPLDLDELLAADVPPRTRGWTSLATATRETFATLNARNLAALFAFGCILAAVFTTLSRGGMIALVAAAVVTWLATHLSGHAVRFGALAAAMALALAMIMWVGLGEQVERRIGQILEVNKDYNAGRGELLVIGARLASQYWRTGSGLGTFRYVNKPEVPTHREVYYEYAENQYVDTAVEAGVLGLLLLFAVIGLQAYILWRLLKSSAEAIPWAAAGVFALASQTIQAGADFGLYLPSNLLLFGVLCGAIAGRTAMLAEEGHAPRRRALVLPGGAYWCPAIVTVLLIATGAGALEAQAAAAIDQQRIATQWNGDPKLLVREEIELHAAELGSALHGRWDDAAGQARMAELDILLFRFRAVDELRDADSSDEQLWPLTSPAALHGRAAEMVRDGDTTGLEQLRVSPSIVEYLGPAWKHLAASRQACPMFDEVHSRLGELAFLVGDPLDDDIDFRRALSLEPSNVAVLVRVGLLDLDAGRTDQGAAEVRQAWELDPPYTMSTAGDALVARMPISFMLDKIIPHTPEALMLFGERLNGGGHPEEARRVLQVTEEVVDASSLSDARRAYYHGKIAMLRGSRELAIEQYRRAIELDGSVAVWHYELAILLERSGQMNEALEEARRAWRLQPVKGYAHLVDRLNNR